ncbi:MAG: 2TM domain-containing protein [Dehalococcoidia bacterium]|nr:2TM domain-containing protein [Dehalococcoidia bacterium]
MPDEDDRVEIDLPFFHVRVGGPRRRISFGSDDEEDVINMERDDSLNYQAVRRHVRRRLRFFRHAFTFVALNGLFVLVDWLTGGSGSGVNWSQWVALIWGVFLGWELVSTFIAPYLWGREAEERLVERELRRRRGA